MLENNNIENIMDKLNEFTRMELLELSDDDSKWNRYQRRTTIDDFEVSIDDIEDLEIDFQDVDLLTYDALKNSGTTSEYDAEQDELSDEDYLKLKQQGFTGYNNDRNKNNINNKELDTFNKLALTSPDLVMWAKVRNYDIIIVFQDFVNHFNEIASKDDLETKLENYVMTALDMCDLLVDCGCCLTGDNEIKLSNGEIIDIETLYERFNNGETLKVYNYNFERNVIEEDLIETVTKTGKQSKFVIVELEDGSIVSTTPEHKYLTAGLEFVEARDLDIHTILYPNKRIKEITSYQTKEPEWVYDITMDRNKNFQLENDVILHNCDFYYRFSYLATQGGYGFFKQDIPAPIRNPEERGAMCKHLNKLLDRWDLWESKLVNLIVQKLKDKDYLALKTN